MDKNTEYFHRMATIHERIYGIDVLHVECNTITDLEDMLLGLFINVKGCVSDAPKLVYFWRIRHGCGIKNEESTQLSPEDIKSHIQDFYLKLYKESKSWMPDFIVQDAPVIRWEEQDNAKGI